MEKRSSEERIRAVGMTDLELLRVELKARKVLLVTLKERVHHEELIIEDLIVRLEKIE